MFNRIFTTSFIVLFVHYLPNLQMKFMIMHLVLLIDPGVVSEGKHIEPPNQKRRSDNGKFEDFHNYIISISVSTIIFVSNDILCSF